MAVIEVNDLVKSFKVYKDKGHTLKDLIMFAGRRNFERREVLRGVNFTAEGGETLGLVGHNGCGKSTLLKVLTKILYPDSGTIKTVGRVSSLLELGAGFHPDLSGRENIYANAAVFGMKRREIDAVFDEIVAFSELEKFLDNPVRTYSSGMYMRLAFSVAINVNADILLIDEILAVGDIAFQSKCFSKMEQLKHSGTTIVFVSHTPSVIERLCTRALWLNDGVIAADGEPGEVMSRYLAFLDERTARTEREAGNEGPSIVRNIGFFDEKGTPTSSLISERPAKLSFDYVGAGTNIDYFTVAVSTIDGRDIFYTHSFLKGMPYGSIPQTGGRISVDFPAFMLSEGRYYVRVFARSADGSMLEKVFPAYFDVSGNGEYGECCLMEHHWTTEK